MSTLKKATEIAAIAHADKTDKAGKPYINHPKAVMKQMPVNNETMQIIAILHDVVEDNPGLYSFEGLSKEGFCEEILTPLKHLTKTKGENYWDYIRRVADDDIAIEVKLADLAHNSERKRIPNPGLKDEARWNRYNKATKYLKIIKEFKANHSKLDLTKPPYKYILNRLLYGVIREDYAEFCKTIVLILQAASKTVCGSAIVQGRAKNLDSFTEKCARKAGKYKTNNFKEMTDLCGTRVVFQTTGQVEDFCEFVERNFEIDSENSEDTSLRLGDSEFGYLSNHYIVSFKPEIFNILGVDININRFKHMKGEIQVRTFAQHIWADTLHDRMYKSAVQPLKEHKKEAAKLASLLVNTDFNLNKFVVDYDIFSLNQTSYMTVKKIEEELDILEAMNFSETYIFTRFTNALKMTGYLRNLGRSKQITTLLKPYIADEEKGILKLDIMTQTRLWFEYGLSLLASPKNNMKAYNYIDMAVKALDKYYNFSDLDNSDKWLEARRLYVFMLVTAGTIAHKKDWLERALRVDFTNPYACAEMLSHTTLSHSLLRGAVSAAREHLRAEINEPEVYFVLGRLWLSLKDENRAFKHYADGLLFYLAKSASEVSDGKNLMVKNIRVQQILEREIQYLDGDDSDIAIAIKDLMNRIFTAVYEKERINISKVIWVSNDNKVLKNSSGKYKIRKFTAADLSGRINEMANEIGYLFIENEDDLLAKAALVLGFKVISTFVDMNNNLVTDEKIRKTIRFYTLPCEEESLKALFIERKVALTSEQLDSTAKSIHEKYAIEMHEKHAVGMIEDMRKSGKTPADLGERTANWDSLDNKYKTANIDQAEYAPILFEQAGFVFNNDSAGAIGWSDISDEKKLELAKLEHGRWNVERVTAGWSYYPVRDNEKLFQPNIVAWNQLDVCIQKYDFDAVEGLIGFYADAGLYLHEEKGEGK
jgi:ppGpp synthetase/RelA/SpoT-type nucleotidyltranferase